MFRRVLALLTLVGLLLVLQAPPALADTAVVDETLHVVQVISLLVGVVLPVLVGLVTKVTTSESTKAILLAALSAVSGFLSEYGAAVGAGTFNWFDALLTAITTFVVAVAMHYGLWKPTGVAARAQATGVR